MQDFHLRGWTILFCCLLSLGGIGYLIHVVRELHRDHKKIAGGIPVGDIEVIKETIDKSSEGIRQHISSNHDELDGEMRRIADSTDATRRQLDFDTKNKFSADLTRELDAARAVKEALKLKPKDSP